MNLQRLRYLVEVADGASLSAAARRLRISQPVLSRAIRTLERELQADLVVVEGRRLRIRPDAEAVVAAAREALAAVDRVQAAARRTHAQDLTIAASPSHQSLLAPLLTELGERAGTTVRLLTASDTDDIARLLLAGRADLGVGEAVGAVDDLEVHPLGVLELVLAAAAGTELPQVVELRAQPRLQVAALDDPRRMALLADVLGRAGGSFEAVFVASDRMVLQKAVEAGVAPTIGPRAMVERNPLLTCAPFAPPVGYPVVALVDRRRASPATGAVLEGLAAVAWS